MRNLQYFCLCQAALRNESVNGVRVELGNVSQSETCEIKRTLLLIMHVHEKHTANTADSEASSQNACQVSVDRMATGTEASMSKHCRTQQRLSFGGVHEIACSSW
jgi:hypothetical protein